MKRIGFLSFGHWTPSPQSATRSAADALLQSIDLAVAAEELGADGAYFRVHHFARQLASPFPLLAAVGEKIVKIPSSPSSSVDAPGMLSAVSSLWAWAPPDPSAAAGQDWAPAGEEAENERGNLVSGADKPRPPSCR